MKRTDLNTNICSITTILLLAAAHASVAQEEAGSEATYQEDPEQIELITLDHTRRSDDDESERPVDESDEIESDEVAGYLDPEAQRAADVDELSRNFELYKEAIANSSLDEADTLAKRIVELSIGLYGLNSHESAKALTNLAIVQQRSKDYESAQLNFQASIDIVERIEDRLHASLINPLKGLGATQLSAGRPDLARETFDRAVHVTHVNEGPHNLGQVDILDALTEIYLSVGEIEDALDLQENAFALYARNADMDSEEFLPALERNANWMHRMRLYNRERNAYRKMIKIIENTRGRDDLALIEPLTGLGNSYLYVGSIEVDYHSDPLPISSGEVYLKRALRIAEENPDSDWRVLEGAMLSLGDFYTLSSRPARAKRMYQDTWELLSDDDERLRSRHEQLETLVRLQDISPPKYYNSQQEEQQPAPADNFEVGTIVAGYTVTARGEVSRVSIVQSDPPGFEEMEKAVLREMRYLMHRPRIEMGSLVETPDQTYTHEFFYRESDLASVAHETEVIAE